MSSCLHCWHFIWCGDSKKGNFFCCECQKIQTFKEGVDEIIQREIEIEVAKSKKRDKK